MGQPLAKTLVTHGPFAKSLGQPLVSRNETGAVPDFAGGVRSFRGERLAGSGQQGYLREEFESLEAVIGFEQIVAQADRAVTREQTVLVVL